MPKKPNNNASTPKARRTYHRTPWLEAQKIKASDGLTWIKDLADRLNVSEGIDLKVIKEFGVQAAAVAEGLAGMLKAFEKFPEEFKPNRLSDRPALHVGSYVMLRADLREKYTGPFSSSDVSKPARVEQVYPDQRLVRVCFTSGAEQTWAFAQVKIVDPPDSMETEKESETEPESTEEQSDGVKTA